MKKLLSILLIAGATSAFAQPKGKAPKMAPVLTKGYYLTLKGDSVRGEIQTNPEDPTSFYSGFSFKSANGGKVAAMSTKKAKGYGFDGRHFILIPLDANTEAYIEVLARGRLMFYELKYNDTKNGEAVISSKYFVQDTQAAEKDAALKEIKQLSNNFYKKELKPYMKDQAMTWTDLDKFVLNKEAVTKAINEFNKFYEQGQ
jgi:hypothetical protein